ncbi:hypothetical protein RB195_019588 [Necator americanus]|uniref:Secreted protein n=1 Tax=Necator americanus TaxID=51031 RepID=A0ABR1CGJ3_NECAM
MKGENKGSCKVMMCSFSSLQTLCAMVFLTAQTSNNCSRVQATWSTVSYASGIARSGTMDIAVEIEEGTTSRTTAENGVNNVVPGF